MELRDSICFIKIMVMGIRSSTWIISMVLFFCSLGCGLNSFNLNILLSPDGKASIYLYESHEEDNRGFNEKNLYLYLTETKLKNRHTIPQGNYLKLRYSEMCPFYIKWGEVIEVIYPCLDKWDNLSEFSKLQLNHDIELLENDSLKVLYIMYDFENI